MGWLELPAESVRGGGLLVADSRFWMRRGPTTGVSGASSLRRNSSSSGRPCLRASRPSMVLAGDMRAYVWVDGCGTCVGRGIAGDDDRSGLFFGIFGSSCRSSLRCSTGLGGWWRGSLPIYPSMYRMTTTTQHSVGWPSLYLARSLAGWTNVQDGRCARVQYLVAAAAA